MNILLYISIRTRPKTRINQIQNKSSLYDTRNVQNAEMVYITEPPSFII